MNKEQDELNKIKIPLADLRMQIVQLMKDGFNEVPLGDFLYILQKLYRESADKST